MRLVKRPVRVGIVSRSPILAGGLQRLLERGPESFRCRQLADLTSSPLPTGETDVLLIALHCLEEAQFYLTLLKARSPWQPRLLLADPCLVGVSLSLLERQLFTIVPPAWSAEELRISLRLLAAGHPLCTAADLLQSLARALPHEPGDQPTSPPTQRQLECACAASLGLSNQQIGSLLYLEETTVREHLHHLFRKLSVTNRWDLGIALRRALSSLPPPF